MLFVNVGHDWNMSDVPGIVPPFDMALLAGIARQYCEVAAIDLYVDPHALPEAMLDLPDIVVVSVCGNNQLASTYLMPFAAAVVKQIREIRGASVKIFLFGTHVAALPELSIQQTGADGCLRGDGMADVATLASGHEVASFATESIPLPAWDLLPWKKYRAHNWHGFGEASRQPYGMIWTSLGCPWGCKFCCITTLHPRPVRYASERQIRVQAEWWARQGVRMFKFYDEQFLLPQGEAGDQRLDMVASVVRPFSVPGKWNIWTFTRTDTISAYRLDVMRAMNVRWMAYGFETASTKLLNSNGVAKNNFADAIKVAQITRQADLNIGADFVVGLPNETPADFLATLNMIMTICPEWLNIYPVVNYPGSGMWDGATPNSVEGWYSYGPLSPKCKAAGTGIVSPSDVVRWRDWIWQTYMTSPKYLRRLQDRFGVTAMRDMMKWTRNVLPRVDDMEATP
jgi:radical SAM superfamily enzyme YgiQ (UPF0313 family)